MIGKIKWYDEDRGFGFVENKEGQEAFVHVSQIKRGIALVEHEAVTYGVRPADKGDRAIGVAPLTLPDCEECGKQNDYSLSQEKFICRNYESTGYDEYVCTKSESYKEAQEAKARRAHAKLERAERIAIAQNNIDEFQHEFNDALDKIVVPPVENDYATNLVKLELRELLAQFTTKADNFSEVFDTHESYIRANDLFNSVVANEDAFRETLRALMPSERLGDTIHKEAIILAVATRYYRSKPEFKEDYKTVVTFRNLMRDAEVSTWRSNAPNVKIADMWKDIEDTYGEEIALAITLLKYEGEDKLSIYWIGEALKHGLLFPFLGMDVPTIMAKVAEGDRIVKLNVANNRRFLSDLGVAPKTIEKGFKSGLFGRIDLRYVDFDIEGYFTKIARDKDSSTEARLKGDGISGKVNRVNIGKIIKHAKGSPAEITALIKKYYANIQSFLISPRKHPTDPDLLVKVLYLFDDKKVRIYHSTK